MTDAIINPGAMMVHLKDTEATFTAMMRSLRLPGLLTNALFAILVLTVLALKRSNHALRNPTRVRKCSSQMTKVRHQAKAIECDKIEETLHCKRYALNKLLVD